MRSNFAPVLKAEDLQQDDLFTGIACQYTWRVVSIDVNADIIQIQKFSIPYLRPCGDHWWEPISRDRQCARCGVREIPLTAILPRREGAAPRTYRIRPVKE